MLSDVQADPICQSPPGCKTVLRFRGDGDDGEVETMLQFQVYILFLPCSVCILILPVLLFLKKTPAYCREVIHMQRALEMFYLK